MVGLPVEKAVVVVMDPCAVEWVVMGCGVAKEAVKENVFSRFIYTDYFVIKTNKGVPFGGESS